MPMPIVPFATMDPAAKLAAAFCFAVGTSQIGTSAMAAAACLIALAVMALGGVDLRRALASLASINVFFLFLWVTLPLGVADRPDVFAVFGPFRFNHEGLRLALTITLKGNAIAMAFISLPGTSSVSANGRALLRLGFPRKLVALMLLTHANLGIMRHEIKCLFQAARLRGFTPGFSRASLVTGGWLLGMLLVRSWRRARHVGEAMKLRGFCGMFPLIDPVAPSPMGRGTAVLFVAGCALIPVSLRAFEAWRGLP